MISVSTPVGIEVKNLAIHLGPHKGPHVVFGMLVEHNNSYCGEEKEF